MDTKRQADRASGGEAEGANERHNALADEASLVTAAALLRQWVLGDSPVVDSQAWLRDTAHQLSDEGEAMNKLVQGAMREQERLESELDRWQQATGCATPEEWEGSETRKLQRVTAELERFFNSDAMDSATGAGIIRGLIDVLAGTDPEVKRGG